MATTLPSPGIANKGFISTDPELAAVDASVRWPVLISFLSSVHWMVVGTFLLIYASSLSHPQDSFPILGLLNDLSHNVSFFTYGRIWPAAIDALVYGWASTAGLGLAIWLMARLTRTPMQGSGALVTGIAFWNLGVATGLTLIFLGYGNGVEFLEFPLVASVTLWLAYAIVAVWVVGNYLSRKQGHDHLAQSWLIVALFAFPWLYAAGSILLSGSHPLPGSGVIQGLIGAWYVHGIFTLWLAPLGLAVLYYLIPKISGLAIEHASKAKIAFWTWLVLAPWTAVHDMVGGPFPEQTVTIGLILSGLIFVPVTFIGLNLISTALKGEAKQGHHGGIIFPFLILASVVFVIAGISEQLLSIRSINEVLRFTMFRECNTFLWVFGFFSFTAFGAIYYIVPRLLDFGWRSSLLIRIHYYASLYGILLFIAICGFGGFIQGVTLENPDPTVTILMATEVTTWFHIASTLCISLISLGNGIFALHLGWMLLDWVRIKVRANPLAAEILMEPYEEEVPAQSAAKEVTV